MIPWYFGWSEGTIDLYLGVVLLIVCFLLTASHFANAVEEIENSEAKNQRRLIRRKLAESVGLFLITGGTALLSGTYVIYILVSLLVLVISIVILMLVSSILIQTGRGVYLALFGKK